MYSLIEPLTKPETYQTLLSNLIMIVIYIIVAWIVLRFINKGIEQFFKIQNKGKKANKKRSATLISLVQNIEKELEALKLVIRTNELDRNNNE